MNTTKISHVAHLIEICVQHGVTKVVISPGSRNAPLIIGFDAHPKIEVFLVHDERSAAFFAMGMAEESKSPVAITCTSGSAPINYAPAISEAYYRNIPLVVLTADRPIELIDQGDGQTIRQKNLYQNFIKGSFELPNIPSKAERNISDEIANDALNLATQAPKGPVHINVPLAEPLYETQNLSTVPIITQNQEITAAFSGEDKAEIEQKWKLAQKKLILIGQIDPNELDILSLDSVLGDASVAILVENTSNLLHFQRICHSIDRTLAIISEAEVPDFAPDLLITMGGAIISKKIKAFLRTNKPRVNWRIGQYLFEEDTFQSLSRSFQVKPATFFQFIGSLEQSIPSNFGGKWKQKDFMAYEIHSEYLTQAPFSDLKAFELILDAIPDNSNIHMANSSVVRYCQLFNPVRGMSYYGNRGVSGIDGSTSTAVGVANISKEKLNIIISGDTSFFYDSNAFWNNYLPSNFRIIVINNGGGGIFKIIEGPNNSEQSHHFVAPFKAKIEAVCDAFNVHYFQAKNTAELENVFNDFYEIKADKRPVLLEVITSDISNEKILKKYFKKIGKSTN
ncbi:MAG: 2-succinyl-5-enolpyruvyl-6-hydroxy-3-cyclohexene-1-carboxylic-acid synthase [Crocinitomix sp.]|nr:2-succinyl-5-enolpyruvyl-6-hydroxy-3-cyclohexene-1-carboxylic-acid synthase [Crocinitomix sp.]